MSALKLALSLLLSCASKPLYAYCVFSGEEYEVWQIQSKPDWCPKSLRMNHSTGVCVSDISEQREAGPVAQITSLGGEVASETPALFIYFALIPCSQGGSFVWRLSRLQHLCWLLFAITMLHLVSKLQRFPVKHLQSAANAQLPM